jgi:hypothetical protein
MLAEIDTICKQEKVYPHAVLSGHAHNYQRYTRKLNFGGSNYTVPFIVCGNSGHNVQSLVFSRSKVKPPDPALHADVHYLDPSPVFQNTGLTIDGFDHTNYGYLRITVDPKQLRIEYNPVTGGAAAVDTVVVDLGSHTVVR